MTGDGPPGPSRMPDGDGDGARRMAQPDQLLLGTPRRRPRVGGAGHGSGGGQGAGRCWTSVIEWSSASISSAAAHGRGGRPRSRRRRCRPSPHHAGKAPSSRTSAIVDPRDPRRRGRPRRPPRWRRSAGRGRPARPAGLVGQARGSANVSRSGGSKSSRRSVGPVDAPERRGEPARVGEGVADGQAHVGHRQLGDGGAVGELDHRVHDRLGVDDHLDAGRSRRRTARGPRSPRAPCSSACEESTVIFGPIAQVGWARASADGDRRPARRAVRPRNGPPLRREHDPAQLAAGAGAGPQALVDGAVLGVDRDELGARRRPQRLHHRPGGDERLLVGQRQPLAGPQRRRR